MNILNFDKLARETFDLNQKISDFKNSEARESFLKETAQSESFDIDALWEVDSVEFEDKDGGFNNLVPISPGIIFNLEIGKSTFCIRGFASQNLAQDYDDLILQNRGLRSLIRLSDEASKKEILDSVFYFETSCVETAEVLVDQIMNRRFPLQDELLFNISDPGFYWWLQENENEFKISFRTPVIERDKNFECLGPLGDNKISIARFFDLFSLFKKEFGILNLKSDEKTLVFLKSPSDSTKHKNFRKFLSEGENFFSLNEELSPTLFFFIEELTSTRRFWLLIHSLIF